MTAAPGCASAYAQGMAAAAALEKSVVTSSRWKRAGACRAPSPSGGTMATDMRERCRAVDETLHRRPNPVRPCEPTTTSWQRSASASSSRCSATRPSARLARYESAPWPGSEGTRRWRSRSMSASTSVSGALLSGLSTAPSPYCWCASLA